MLISLEINMEQYRIKFGNIFFEQNGVLASGILGVTGWSMVRIARSGAGGIVCKSISKNARKGHPNPVIQVFDHGVINGVGLSSTGVKNSNDELKVLKENCGSRVIASVFGGTKEEFAETVELLDKNFIDAVELNISCPNVHSEFGLPFSSNPEDSFDVVSACRVKTDLMLIAKLSPNFPNIGLIAKACEDAGADAISAINTVGPGMLIDKNTFLPKLSNKTGGVSGPAILPVAIRCVYDIYRNVGIPIIGMGGITCTDDALQMIMAGATLYGVGTGILYEGTDIFKKINSGIDEFLEGKKMTYEQLIGITHRTVHD
jgi:dihydroorotate dehydrogenase (NAD+) catalytic subunit